MTPIKTLREIPVTLGTDGQYHAKVTVGTKPNGKPDRRHRSGATADEVRAKLRDLLAEVDAGRTPRAGRAATVAAWFEQWLTDIAPTGKRALAPRTLADYWSAYRTWIGPELGHLRLDALEPEHLQAMYAKMARTPTRTGEPTSPGRILKVHAVVRRGLRIAVRWRKATRNVAWDMDAPGYGEAAQESLTQAEVRAVLAVARTRPAPWARWQLAAAIGPRQGEVLGLRWSDVDLDAGVVTIAWQVQRRSWQHGCGVGKIYHCARRPASCPGRRLDLRRDETQLTRLVRRGGKMVAEPVALVFCRPKGWRRRPRPRVVGVPAGVVAELRRLRAAQAAARLAAGVWWNDHDLVFTQPNGQPLGHRQDYAEWHEVLAAAGLPPARVHVLRHTAATVLLELGEQPEVVQEVLGHADPRTTRAYQDVSTALTHRAAARMDTVVGGEAEVVNLDERRRMNA
jgi:integrase